jgi:voltage-gated potassium channel
VVSKIGELATEHSRRRFLGMDGTHFSGHYIVIGWNDIGRIVINEMISAGFKVAVLTHEEKDITEMKLIFSDPTTFFATLGITGDGAAFHRLNIDEAVGAILLTGDDATTLVTVLELKQASPDLKITAYVQNSQLKRTVENAGVSYVIAPNEVVGRMIASATFEPDVSNFLEDILSTTTGDDDLDLQEFRLLADHELAGASFGHAARLLEEKTEARLLSFSRRRNMTWQIVKSSLGSEILQADDYLIVLANYSSSRKLVEYMRVPQGRRT